MLKYTKHNLNRLEEVFRELNITVRYEKGNFQSGYCIVTGKNMVIINKFFEVEGRYNTLLEILDQLQYSTETLSPESAEWLERVKKAALHSAA
jgi:hypothetical protein